MIFSYFEIDVSKFDENEFENVKNLIIIFIKTKKSWSRFHNKWINFNNQNENIWKRFKSRQNYICKNCDDNYKLKNCFLTLNKNKFWIKNENRKIFENNMKIFVKSNHNKNSRMRMFFHEFKKWCSCSMCIFKTIRTMTFSWILMFPFMFFINETDSRYFDFLKKKNA